MLHPVRDAIRIRRLQIPFPRMFSDDKIGVDEFGFRDETIPAGARRFPHNAPRAASSCGAMRHASGNSSRALRATRSPKTRNIGLLASKLSLSATAPR